MNSLQRNKPNKSGVPRYVWIIVIFIILASGAFFFPRATRTITTTLTKPVWTFRDNFISDLNFVGNYFASKNSLITQNSALQTQVVALQLKSADYDTVTAENQTLKAMLGRTETMGSATISASSTETNVPGTYLNSRVLARVLSKPPQSPYDTLVLDAGSADGVTLGRNVFMSDTILIGTVTDVTPHTSLVTLFSSSDQKNTVEDSRTGASFELDGAGGANFTVTVPKDTDILWGDTFVYPALSPEIMATVYYVDTASQSSFKTVYLRIPQNIFSAQWVFVDKN